jgi:hypothetical protein
LLKNEKNCQIFGTTKLKGEKKEKEKRRTTPNSWENGLVIKLCKIHMLKGLTSQ